MQKYEKAFLVLAFYFACFPMGYQNNAVFIIFLIEQKFKEELTKTNRLKELEAKENVVLKEEI